MSFFKKISAYWRKQNIRQHCKTHMMLIIGIYMLVLLLSVALFGVILTWQTWQANRQLALKTAVSQVDNVIMLWEDDIQGIELCYLEAQYSLNENVSYTLPNGTIVFTFKDQADEPQILYANGNAGNSVSTASQIKNQILQNSKSSAVLTDSNQDLGVIFRYGQLKDGTDDGTTFVVSRPVNSLLVKQLKSNSNILSFWAEDAEHNVVPGLTSPDIDPNAIRLSYRKSTPRAVDDDSSISYAEINGRIVLYRNLSHIQSSIYLVLKTKLYDYANVFLWPIIIMMAFLTLISYMIYNHFKRNVYLPVVQIEKAVNGIVEEDMSEIIHVDDNNEFKPLADNINSITTRIREILNREYNAKILRKQAEINALQSQINPHFLYNTLDSIRGQALSQGSFEVANLLKSLSNLFRYSINQASSIVTLGEELRHIDHYLTIQQYRFNNKFSVIKNIPDLEELVKCQIPKLTIQPIVENAIFHGLEKKPGKGSIEIRAYATEKRLIVEIEDDGVGMDEKTLRKLNDRFAHGGEPVLQEGHSRNKSIALVNVNQRIQLLYGNRYGLKIFSTLHEGTVVQIVLPLIIKKEE